MTSRLRRLAGLGMAAVFATIVGLLAAEGHTPIALGLIGGAVAFTAVMAMGSRTRDIHTTRRLAELRDRMRHIDEGTRRRNERDAERDERLRERERRVINRMEELERRLLAGFEAERQRAAVRHRETIESMEREGR